MPRKRGPKDQKGTKGEACVQYAIVNLMNCTYIPTGEKEPSIDGVIRLTDPENDSHLNIGVQVKTGPSYIAVPKGEVKYAYIKLDSDDVIDWQLSNIPTIVVWVEDPDISPTRMLWGDARKAKRKSGKLKVSTRAEFGRSALSDIVEMAKIHAGRPSIPRLTGKPLFPTKVTEVRESARTFYNSWRAERTVSPAFGRVDVTLKGWRHLTRNTSAQIDIAHRVALLPFAREILKTASRSQFVRKLKSGRERSELHVLSGLYRPNYGADAIVEVVVEVDKRGRRIKKATFHSVYERRDWRP
jgi:hypothetical protein